MQHIYTVSPVKHQPQWDDKPQPIRYPWWESLIAVGIIVLVAYIVMTGLYAAWLLAGGL